MKKNTSVLKNEFLPFALPSIGEEEIEEVVDTLRSGWLTTGMKTKLFEQAFSEFIGGDVQSLAVNSATAGLHLALEAVGIQNGDKVITTSYTFTATAEVIRYMGADPVFVDINPKSFNLNVELIEDAIDANPGVKAIIPVHFAGQACELSKILEIARRHDLYVIEDAAHALPSTYQGKLIGNHGDISVFSFYATKTITTGEGGMVVSKNSELIERMRIMRLHGISHDVFDRYTSDKPAWYYEVVAPGFKYNMTDVAASLGIHQLKKANLFQRAREAIAIKYNEGFKDLPLNIPHVSYPNDVHSSHLYVIQLKLEKLKISRDRFIELMAIAGIGTSVHFIPLYLHPYWKNKYQLVPDDFPASDYVYQRAVSLPIYPKMTNADVERVIESVKDVLLGNMNQC
jgi:dTDP-4-amino-4,6-dideoxygalactose transaminase